MSSTTLINLPPSVLASPTERRTTNHYNRALRQDWRFRNYQSQVRDCSAESRSFERRLTNSTQALAPGSLAGIASANPPPHTVQVAWDFIWNYLRNEEAENIRRERAFIRDPVSQPPAEAPFENSISDAELTANRLCGTSSVADATREYVRFLGSYNFITSSVNSAGNSVNTSLRLIYYRAHRAYIACHRHLMNLHYRDANWKYFADRARRFAIHQRGANNRGAPNEAQHRTRDFATRMADSTTALVTKSLEGIVGVPSSAQQDWNCIWNHFRIEEASLKKQSRTNSQASSDAQPVPEDISSNLTLAEEASERVCRSRVATEASREYLWFRAYYSRIVDYINELETRQMVPSSLLTVFFCVQKAYLRCNKHLLNLHYLAGNWAYIADQATQCARQRQSQARG